MVQKKFDQKTYQGRTRVLLKVPGTNAIYRVWVWSEERKLYSVPERGKVFEAFRYDPGIGKPNGAFISRLKLSTKLACGNVELRPKTE